MPQFLSGEMADRLNVERTGNGTEEGENKECQ